MRKKIIYPAVIVLIFTANNLCGQIYQPDNMFFEEWYSLNPASIGAGSKTSVLISSNLTGTGIENAPANYSLIGRAALTENMGMGIRFNQYNRGYFKTTNIIGSYAYALNLAEVHTVSFGLSVGVNTEKFTTTDMDVLNSEDPVLQGDNITNTTFINEFGVHYTWESLHAGFVAPYVFQGYNRYLAYASYTYAIPSIEKFWVVPIVLYQYLPEKKSQADIVLKVMYDFVWAAYSYRTNKDMVASLGVNYMNFDFAYAFGFSQGQMSSIISNNHEIMLRYNLNFGSDKKSSIKQPWN